MEKEHDGDRNTEMSEHAPLGGNINRWVGKEMGALELRARDRRNVQTNKARTVPWVYRVCVCMHAISRETTTARDAGPDNRLMGECNRERSSETGMGYEA